MASFFDANASSMLTYVINRTTCGSFTTPNGIIVSIPSGAFVTQDGILVNGDVTIRFNDIYSRSEMLFSVCMKTPIFSLRLRQKCSFTQVNSAFCHFASLKLDVFFLQTGVFLLTLLIFVISHIIYIIALR